MPPLANPIPESDHETPAPCRRSGSRDNTIERFTPGGAASVIASTGLSTPAGLAFERVVAPVPEPASLAVLAMGAAGLCLMRRKQVRSAGGLA